MRGISFEVHSDESSILATILDGISINNFFWNITEDEIYFKDGEELFEEKQVTGKDFLNKITQLDYSIIFANIKAYPDKNISSEINNYEDFLSSRCELIILCYDVFYYEVYSKSKSIIEVIKTNCIKNGFGGIEYITKENDCRTVFTVL
jgi:hypothetical protein